jgi:hypothetical protein
MLKFFKQKELKALNVISDIDIQTIILNEGVGSIDVFHISWLSARGARKELYRRVF